MGNAGYACRQGMFLNEIAAPVSYFSGKDCATLSFFVNLHQNLKL